MKKLFAALTALLPVIYTTSMLLLAFLGAEDEALFAVLGIYLMIGFLFPLAFYLLTAHSKRKFLAVANLWFYAGNLLLLAAEALIWFYQANEVRIAEQNGAMEGGLGLALLIFLYLPHWITYLWVRIFGSLNTSKVLTDICNNTTKTVNMLLQLFPVSDLLSAIWVLGKAKAFQSFQQPPIEMK